VVDVVDVVDAVVGVELVTVQDPGCGLPGLVDTVVVVGVVVIGLIVVGTVGVVVGSGVAVIVTV
jgi:hypothetical protein